MKHTKTVSLIIIAIACMLSLGMLCGCSGVMGQGSSNTGVAQAQSDNRQYMSTLNQQMDQMNAILADFNAAVSSDDVVAMQAQQTKATQVIDAVKNTPATETLQSTKDAYVDALCTLNDALASYVTLYSDNHAQALDADTYTSRLAEVQSAYDSGISKLSDADASVARLNEESQAGGQK